MNAQPNTAIQAIKQHQSAVAADEAMFDVEGICLDAEGAELTLAAEVKAFRDLCSTPCQNSSDVQRKIDYIVNGTIGQRDALIHLLADEDYGGVETLKSLLISLMIPVTEAAR